MRYRRSLVVWGGAAAGFLLVGAACYARLGAPQAPRPSPTLGVGATLEGKRVFPADNPWNTDISAMPVDPRSGTLIGSIGLERPVHPDFGTTYNGQPNGIPYIVISAEQAKHRATILPEYTSESDPGPFPIPPDAPIEGGGADPDGDRHVIVVDKDNWKLYELFAAVPEGTGGLRRWKCGSSAKFDLSSNADRPAGWTSADAAGLPIFPGLVRYDEAVDRKEIPHALRFTCRKTRHAYVAPARHFASRSNDPDLPPMGMRVRLKASVDISGYPPTARVILKALKKYGMILADNGGDWFISGSPDSRWNEDELHAIKRLKGKDFEVIEMGKMVTAE